MSPSPSPESVQAVPRQGVTVALGMVGMNAAMYGFTVVASRTLVPEDFGALTALLGILLIGTVAALALQAATARRLAVATPDGVPHVLATTIRVSVVLSASVVALVAVAGLVLTPLLNLSSYVPILLTGATLAPLTMMGAQAGIAQGTRRWGLLTAIYLSCGLGRLACGSVALAVDPSLNSAMMGVAVGGWAPVLIGAATLRAPQDSTRQVRSLVREVSLSSHVLLAYFVLSNLDALVARNLLAGADSGLYASGLILAKAALFFPQFISVVVFGDLARATSGATRWRAAGLVTLIGAAGVVVTLALPQVALVLVGGAQYEAVTGRLWLFAMSGSILALVHLLVFDALARHFHGVTLRLWVAVGAVVAISYGADVHVTGLVVTVAAVAAALALSLLLSPDKVGTSRGSVGRLVPGAAGADGDVERH